MKNFLLVISLLFFMQSSCFAQSELVFTKEQSYELKDLLLHFIDDINSDSSAIDWKITDRLHKNVVWQNRSKNVLDGTAGVLINNTGIKNGQTELGKNVRIRLSTGEVYAEPPIKVIFTLSRIERFYKLFKYADKDASKIFLNYLKSNGFTVHKVEERENRFGSEVFAQISYPDKKNAWISCSNIVLPSSGITRMYIVIFKSAEDAECEMSKSF